MKVKILASAISLGFLLVGFQNCSKTRFGSADNGNVSLQALSNDGNVKIGDDSGTGNVTPPGVDNLSDPSTSGTVTDNTGTGTGESGPGVTVDVGGVETPTPPAPVNQDPPPPQGTVTQDPPPPTQDLVNQDPPAPPTPGNSLISETPDPEAGMYVACILVEHGKSSKLGMVTTGLGGVHSVAESVCITKAECLGDVANAFHVQGSYVRGYCEHNPHVKRLTDGRVKELLGL